MPKLTTKDATQIPKDSCKRRPVVFNPVVCIIATILVVGAGTLGVSKPTPSLAGSWQVDTRHSDAQPITDATTDYGKTKIDITLLGQVSNHRAGEARDS
jgi:hypothetical protein